MRLLFLLAWVLSAGAQALPSAFLVTGGAFSPTDSPKASEFVSVGKQISGATYLLTTIQLAGKETRLYVEGCQRLAQSGPVGLWAYVGLAGSSTTGGVSVGGMISLHLWKSGGLEAGIRSTAAIPRQVQVGLVWEFP